VPGAAILPFYGLIKSARQKMAMNFQQLRTNAVINVNHHISNFAKNVNDESKQVVDTERK
jgi:hypothetical protein